MGYFNGCHSQCGCFPPKNHHSPVYVRYITEQEYLKLNDYQKFNPDILWVIYSIINGKTPQSY